MLSYVGYVQVYPRIQLYPGVCIPIVTQSNFSRGWGRLPEPNMERKRIASEDDSSYWTAENGWYQQVWFVHFVYEFL